MCGVFDFHSEAGGANEANSRGNITWNNLDVNSIYGFYAAALISCIILLD